MVRKRNLLFLALFLMVFSITAASASDVAYIYRKQYAIDQNIVDVIEQNGLSVDFINEADLPMNLNSYLFIYVGDENFRRENFIPVNSVPSIVANYYHIDYWGYADGEGASQLVSNTPLEVNLNGQSVQVYTLATEGIGGPSLPYYYIDAENIAPGLETVALTETTSSGSDFGDVVSIANPGAQLFNGRTQTSKMCFYGIIESNFWTPAARQLFEDCIAHVAAECSQDSDCGEQSFTSAPFCQAGDVYQTQQTPMCENGVVNAQCAYPEDDVLIEECDFGCENGECLNPVCEQDSDCDDSDVYTEDACVNPGTNDAFCENTPIVCFSNSDCDDSNSATQDICNNPGTTDSFCTNEPIACFNDLDCDDGNANTEDTCLNPGTPSSMCENEPIECFVDSDCGTDGPIGSLMCSMEGNVIQDFIVYTCENPGTAQSQCSDETIENTVDDCSVSEICSMGACEPVACFSDSDCDDSDQFTEDTCNNPGMVNAFCTNEPIECFVNSDCDDGVANTQDICNNPGTTDSFCTNGGIACFIDSDCGTDGPVTNAFCSEGNAVQDVIAYTCLNGGTEQASCTSEITEELLDECSNSEICSAGQCIPQSCDMDSDCNDNNPLTLDECINPGTVLNECRNSPINCASDLDCGYTGFIGEEYCAMDGNVAKNFRNAACVNAGEPDSFCSINTVPVIVNECNGLCTAGECIPQSCDMDSDCNDNNPLTLDECINPGTVLNECRNSPINCASDLDCGSSGFVGSEYCSADDAVLKNEQMAVCMNPGQPNSYCEVSVEPEELSQCQFACFEGSCIACDENLDCNDGDANTVDLCYNPGTADAFCQNVNNEEPDIECFGDADCPSDIALTGPFCGINGVEQIFMTYSCINPGETVSYCASSIDKILVEQCSEFCVDGMCTGIECFTDAECDDSDSGTIDTCLNPGTPESMCENTPIDCFVDADCGTDGPVGSEFCSENTVVQDFIEYACLNGGTAQASCTSEVTQDIVESCTTSEVCSEGMCVPVACDEDMDCPDGGYNDDPFCYGDDVYQEFLSGVCTEAGTQNAMCDFTAMDELIEECTYACAEGQCIRCDEDLDCDDGDALTDDTCLNPGTIASMCENEFTGECMPGETMPCGSDEGQCQMGVKTCGQDGMFGACVGEVGPSEEICDEIDNNCDGVVDEGGVCPVCEDECSLGARQCIDGESYELCADFNGDGCTEWSDAAECGFGLVCETGQCVPF